ncbi:DUF445 domain-containing protein [Chitinophaga sp. 30R24]|uniref:DUF445 domain-containing protein n=1 Tax=Chitinophaga sp. 30R24 TaxID=3248838 RepID=UPI003B8F310F
MFFLLPFFAAAIGWLLNSLAITLLFRPYKPVRLGFISIQGILPKRQAALAKALGALVGRELFSFEAIKTKLTDPQKIKNIIPLVEAHLDSFLRERLPKAMPVLSMFIGDSTINQIKSHLVTELDSLFPEIISKYLDEVQQDLDLEKIVAEKIAGIAAEKLDAHAHQLFHQELRQFKLLGAATGFITGIVAMVIALLS